MTTESFKPAPSYSVIWIPTTTGGDGGYHLVCEGNGTGASGTMDRPIRLPVIQNICASVTGPNLTDAMI